MNVRFLASKVTTVAASVALFGGVTAWIAAARSGGQQAPLPDAGGTTDAAAQRAPATIVRKVYVVQRTAPDGSVYFETVAAPAASAQPSAPAAARRAPTTRTRAS